MGVQNFNRPTACRFSRSFLILFLFLVFAVITNTSRAKTVYVFHLVDGKEIEATTYKENQNSYTFFEKALGELVSFSVPKHQVQRIEKIFFPDPVPSRIKSNSVAPDKKQLLPKSPTPKIFEKNLSLHVDDKDSDIHPAEDRTVLLDEDAITMLKIDCVFLMSFCDFLDDNSMEFLKAAKGAELAYLRFRENTSLSSREIEAITIMHNLALSLVPIGMDGLKSGKETKASVKGKIKKMVRLLGSTIEDGFIGPRP